MTSQVTKFFQKTTALVAITSIMTSLGGGAAIALPVNGVVTNGNATINTVGNTMNVSQTTARSDINWNTFNIGNTETVNFNSGAASDITVNRVSAAGGASLIDGMLNSNHRVAILNDAGMTYTSNARVNVGSLVSTTAKGFDVVNGQYQFTNVDSATGGAVAVNQGAQINVSDGGYAVFVAPQVSNAGTIQAKLGRVDLASANGFTIDVNGNGNINYLAGPDLTKSIVSNTGTINAVGGIVNLRADKASNLTDSVINLNGVINVDGMDSNIVGTSPNGSAILANAYGNINAGVDLKAGQIQLASTAGNITTQGLTAVNTMTLNTARAIDLKAGGSITVNGPITAQNMLSDTTNIADAEVSIDGAQGVTLNGDVYIQAENKSGGTAKLDVLGHTGNVLTTGKINVYADGTRIVDAANTPNGDTGGDITSNATANFTGNNIRHTQDVDVHAYAFHDIREFITFLSKTTTGNDNTAFGYYQKDKNGNPISGEILFSNLASILPGSWADLSFVDFNNVGYFLIPNASALNAGLTNRQVVNFKQVNGQWVVADTSGNIIKGADIGAGNDYALFSDKSLNYDTQAHLLNSANGAGELNWSTAVTQFCNYNDYNFSLTDLGGPGKVTTNASYTAVATGQYYTPATGANIYVDSTADAKNSEATSLLSITGNQVVLGDPHVTSSAYKNANTTVALKATNDSLWINAPLVAQSYAASRAVGSANTDLSIDVTNGDLNFGYLPNSYIIADALGGVLANANTTVNVRGNTNIENSAGAVVATVPSRVLMGDFIGSIATTFAGTPADATATTSVNTATAGQIYFRPNASASVPGSTNHPDGYVFSNANGVIAAGGSTQANGNAKINVTNGATLATTVTYSAGTGDTHTPYKNPTDCNATGPCDANPNTNVVGGWKTTTTVTGGSNQVDTSTTPYGTGMTVPPLSFPPYERIDIGILTPTPTPTPSPPPVGPNPNLLVNTPPVEPAFVKTEPASGGGLFCRDVNVAGLPGLCGAPAPVREMALAPIVEEAPAPVYASPFKTGTSTTAKKAQVANLEPGSGNKCLSINGKKVCIEEQIDK